MWKSFSVYNRYNRLPDGGQKNSSCILPCFVRLEKPRAVKTQMTVPRKRGFYGPKTWRQLVSNSGKKRRTVLYFNLHAENSANDSETKPARRARKKETAHASEI